MKSLWKLANAIHLGLYRLTSGRIGGRMGDGTILLLTTTGRKTGKARTVPVLYFLDDDGNPVVTASNAGLPKNPAWFENLRVNPRVTYQIGAERKIARADIAPPELRDRLWTRLTTNFKGFVEYQKKTTRSHSVRFPDWGLRLTTTEEVAAGVYALRISKTDD